MEVVGQRQGLGTGSLSSAIPCQGRAATPGRAGFCPELPQYFLFHLDQDLGKSQSLQGDSRQGKGGAELMSAVSQGQPPSPALQ